MDMKGYLFNGSAHEYREQSMKNAIQATKALSKDELMSPTLAATLDSIARGGDLQVARLLPDQKHGKRRTEQRSRSDYGQTRTVEVTLIDVYIPFEGEAISFQLAPSTSTIIQTPVKVAGNELVATFYDDERVQRDVDELIDQVSGNLDTLRKEMANLRTQIRSTIDSVANERKAQVEAQLQRDKKLSFPIK